MLSALCVLFCFVFSLTSYLAWDRYNLPYFSDVKARAHMWEVTCPRSITWGHISFVSLWEPPSPPPTSCNCQQQSWKIRRLKQLSALQHLHQTKLEKPSIPSHECTIKTMWQKWKLFHHNISQFFLTKAKPPSWIHISQHLMHYASAYSRGPGNCQALVKGLWKCLFCKQMEPRPSTQSL